MFQKTQRALKRNWLSAGALVLLVAGSATLNLWGWAATGSTAWAVAAALCAAVLAAEVYGARGMVHASRAWQERRRVAGVAAFALTAACCAFNAYSGHRALGLVDAQNARPQAEAMAAKDSAQTALQAAYADLAAIAAAEATDCGSRPICADTRRAQIATKPAAIERRNEALAAMAAADAVLANTSAQSVAIGSALAWALAVLIEVLKALAGWTIDRRAPVSKAKPVRRRRRRIRTQRPAKTAPKPRLVVSNQPDLFG